MELKLTEHAMKSIESLGDDDESFNVIYKTLKALNNNPKKVLKKAVKLQGADIRILRAGKFRIVLAIKNEKIIVMSVLDTPSYLSSPARSLSESEAIRLLLET